MDQTKPEMDRTKQEMDRTKPDRTADKKQTIAAAVAKVRELILLH
jgi:hypothetical protein